MISRRRKPRPISNMLAVCSLALACARPSEERALRDLEVGQAHSAALSVHVENGLAAVRRINASELVLWGSAPSFVFEIETPAATTLRLELQNTLPDAELRALTPLPQLRMLSSDAPSDAPAGTPADLPTRQAFELELPAGTSKFRMAAPDADDHAPFRFALLSDVQEAIDTVSDIFERINLQPKLRFLFGAGDLTQRGTPEQLERYQRELLALGIPYFTTLGNHELGTDPLLFHEYFGRGNFQFEFKGVTFTLLDSASATLDPIVYDWLDTWLTAARDRVHVVSMHIAPIDPIGVRNGSFASRAEAAKLLGRLAEGHVDLTVYGHIHSYYAFENAGIPAYISGGGGAIPERFDQIGRHFLVFDIDPQRGVLQTRRVDVDRD
ncbi:MAG: metallophosphoesterase family protein [Myxococcota bacterium]